MLNILQSVNGEKVIVEFVQHEILETPTILYNFEVEGNHNYYVAESTLVSADEFVLVHNKGCKKGQARKINPDILEQQYDLPENTFHRDIKPAIKKISPPNEYLVGKNPDILIDRSGNLAYQGANGKGFQDALISIQEVIQELFGG